MRLYVKLVAMVCAFAGLQGVLSGDGWEVSFYARVYLAGLHDDVRAESAVEDYYCRHEFGVGVEEMKRRAMLSAAAAEGAEGGILNSEF